MDHQSEIFIGGAWTRPRGRELITVIDPSTEECAATVAECDLDDVEAAVSAAVRARRSVSALSGAERAALLRRMANALDERVVALSESITTEMGSPVKHCTASQVIPAIEMLRTTADVVEQLPFVEEVGHSLVDREPAGVVAAITSWNHPLLQATAKVAMALAAGCPVVLKPSQVSPLDALVLAEAYEASGGPAGGLNLIFGTGPNVGEHLVRDRRVAMVSFTGTTATGRRVSQLAAASTKRLSLELSGKSATILLANAEAERAVAQCVQSIMISSGQARGALSRLLVPFGVLSDIEELVAKEMSGYVVGSAHDGNVDVGPLASASQQQRVQQHVEHAQVQGARLVWSLPTEDLPSTGYFAQPMAFAVPDPAIALAQEGVLGPVLALIPYVDDADAIEIANGASYGLTAAVWSEDQMRAIDFARALDTFTIYINGAAFDEPATPPGAPLARYDRAHCRFGIDQYTQLKSIQLPGRARCPR